MDRTILAELLGPGGFSFESSPERLLVPCSAFPSHCCRALGQIWANTYIIGIHIYIYVCIQACQLDTWPRHCQSMNFPGPLHPHSQWNHRKNGAWDRKAPAIGQVTHAMPKATEVPTRLVRICNFLEPCMMAKSIENLPDYMRPTEYFMIYHQVLEPVLALHPNHLKHPETPAPRWHFHCLDSCPGAEVLHGIRRT